MGNNFSDELQNKTVIKIGNNILISCKLSVTTKILINPNQTLILSHSIEYEWFKDNEQIIENKTKYVSLLKYLDVF